MTQSMTPLFSGMNFTGSPLIELLVTYETEIAVRVWDGSQSQQDIFIHEVVQEYRRLVSDVLIPDLEGNLTREFQISNYQKFYDKIPFEVLDLVPIGGGKALVTYRITNEPVLCDRPRDEREFPSSGGSSKRLRGWG